MIKFTLALFLFGATLALADEASDFCSGGPPGRYCRSDLTAYYECTGQSSYTFACPAGAECACFDGPSCANVELVGQNSPCQFPENLPQFPPLLAVFRNTTTTITGRGGSSVTSTYEQIASAPSFGRFRIDTVSASRVDILAIDIYYEDFDGSGSDLHYQYESSSDVCTADSESAPFFGIPSGYRFFNTSVLDGQNVNVYYFRAGGQNNGEDTTYAQFFTTQPDANRYVTPILNTIATNSPQAATSTRTVITYSNAVAGPAAGFPSFPSYYWNPPAICLSASATGSASSSSSGSSPSAPPTDSNSCTDAQRGYMRCTGSSQYQTCDHGLWQAAQSCQSSLSCQQNGNYVYCV